MIDKKTLSLALICIILLAIFSPIIILLNQRVNELQLKSDQVFQIENEINVLESQILDFQSEVTELETDKTALQSQVLRLQSTITIVENEATHSYNEGYGDGKAEGYQEGVIDGVGTGYNIRDPTYAEAMAFVATDQTDKNDYSDGYICMNFVADFKNNAFNAGFRAGCVYIQFPERYHHGIACFDTVDNGLLFIETQTDEIVTVAVGDVYYERAFNNPPNFDDTVEHYVIIW